jgi:DNA-binding CsgD family transcriptional regulator
MSKEELRQHGASKGLTEIQQDILVHRIIDNLKISEICDYRKYGRTTIKYHIGEIKKKLNLKSL